MKKKKTNKPTHSAYSNIIWVLSHQWKHAKASLILLIFIIPMTVSVQFLNIYLPKKVVADVVAHSGFEQILISISMIVGGMFLLNAFINGTTTINFAFFSRFRQKMQYVLTMRNVMVSYQTAESIKYREMNSRAQKALWASGMHCPLTQLSQSTMELITNLLGYLLFGTILSFLNPWIAIILSVTPFINYYFAKRYQNFEYKNRDKWTPIDRKLWYILNKSADFKAAKDIRIFGLSTWFANMYQSLTAERLYWNKKLLWKSFSINLADLIIILIRDGFAYFFLIAMTLQGKITVDNFILYFGAISSFTSWIGGIIGKWNEIHSVSLIICDLRDVFSWEDHTNKGKRIEVQSTHSPGDIRINNLCYQYEGSDVFVLDHINLHIKQGEKIAIVGMNGAGKTTLIKNICGLYQPTSGEISIDGNSVNSFNIKDYYSFFSIVFQDFNYLCVSIAEVVSSDTADNIDRDRVWECLRLAGLFERVQSLPEGIDTPLNKQIYVNGTDLSGGEKQKLVLAKAIYKNAPILILDEPTAALDPIAELEMYQQYDQLTQGKTSIYISHRLSSTRFCDRILFMENGRIMEEGSHAQLMNKGGKYADMYQIQSQYYQDKAGEMV